MSKHKKIADTVDDQMINPAAELFGLRDWLSDAKAAASTIDPETAEVDYGYGDADDPYGFFIDDFLGEGSSAWRSSVRIFYARAPEIEPVSRYGKFARQRVVFKNWPWVWFGDLPEAVQNALWGKHKEKLLSD